jgi:2-keto-4-pentenoate hydratase/2-oxohepta-3-ene-1,7-dioic acid hydratase in catechol pathway
MKLGMYGDGGGRDRPALVVDGAHGETIRLDVERLLGQLGVDEQPATLADVVGTPLVMDALQKISTASQIDELAGQAALRAPLGAETRQLVHRALILCCGHTFPASLPGGQAPGSDEDSKVGWFIQSPNSVIGDGADIVLPPLEEARFAYGGEVAAVFSRACYRVGADEALGHLAGFTIANDIGAVPVDTQPVSDRNRFAEANLAKQHPTFLPIGPVLATADQFDDWSSIVLRSRVNGVLAQECTLRELAPSLPTLIAWLSQTFLFLPGDVLSLGSPPLLAGPEVPLFLSPGDEVEVEVEGIGLLRNRVTAELTP